MRAYICGEYMNENENQKIEYPKATDKKELVGKRIRVKRITDISTKYGATYIIDYGEGHFFGSPIINKKIDDGVIEVGDEITLIETQSQKTQRIYFDVANIKKAPHQNSL